MCLRKSTRLAYGMLFIHQVSKQIVAPHRQRTRHWSDSGKHLTVMNPVAYCLKNVHLLKTITLAIVESTCWRCSRATGAAEGPLSLLLC